MPGGGEDVDLSELDLVLLGLMTCFSPIWSCYLLSSYFVVNPPLDGRVYQLSPLYRPFANQVPQLHFLGASTSEVGTSIRMAHDSMCVFALNRHRTTYQVVLYITLVSIYGAVTCPLWLPCERGYPKVGISRNSSSLILSIKVWMPCEWH